MQRAASPSAGRRSRTAGTGPLRRIGTRNPVLKREALALAARLAKSENPAARWVGKDTQRDLTRPAKKKAAGRAAARGRAGQGVKLVGAEFLPVIDRARLAPGPARVH